MMPKEKGFTLLEVLLATVILAGGLLIVLQAINRSIRGVALSRQYTIASLLAQQKLAELEAGLLSAGETEGDFGEEYPDYLWEISVMGRGELDVDLEEVTLVVSWAGRSLSVTTYQEPHQAETGL